MPVSSYQALPDVQPHRTKIDLTNKHKNATAKSCVQYLPPNLFHPAWIVATAVCVWFLFRYAPRFLSAKKNGISTLLSLHLVGVYSVYLACVHNTVLTPSTLGGYAKPLHVWVGRFGLLFGIVGAATGFYLAWFVYEGDSTFAVGVTIGGVSQLFCEYHGYLAVRRYQAVSAEIAAASNETPTKELRDARDEHLVAHVDNMIGLFVLACGIPGVIRLAEVLGGNNWLFPLIVFAYATAFWLSRHLQAKIKRKRVEEDEALLERQSINTTG